MSKKPRLLFLIFSIGLVGLAHLPAAHADSAAAVSLFDEGNRLYEAGNFADACPKYEASLRLDATSIDTRGRLALCYEKVGRLASAWSAWREVRSRAGRTVGRERAADIAASHIAELEPRLARLTLQPAKGAPAGLTVSIDGNSFPVESFGVPMAVDKGKHRIDASAPGHDPWSVEVAMSDGDKKTVEVGPLTKSPVAATPPVAEPSGPAPVLVSPPPPERTRKRPSSTRKWIGIVTLGVGVGVIGYGGIVGLDAIAKRDDAVAEGCDSDLSGCESSMALELANNAYDRANTSTAIVIGGSVLAVTGIILWATAPSASDYEERTAWRVTPTLGRGSGGLAFTGAF